MPKRPISLAVVVVVLAGLVQSSALTSAPAARLRAAQPGLTQLRATAPDSGGRMIGIATFGGRRPTGRQIGELKKLGLTVQVLRRLPMALLYGPKARLVQAAERGIATDVYPNERVNWLSKESRGSMRADKIPADLTGKGVGVAIVDSGIDATHPDLADHVTHNVKLVSPEYLNQTGATYLTPDDTPLGYLVIPVDQGPYNNSDLGSGHGTHVSGIVAADATTSGEQLGVAPEASLIGYSTGDVALIFSIVAAYDDILIHHKEWGIRVVNNSWGSAFRVFDPGHPINIATKAVHDAGIVVAFSAGNDGTEMQVNPWSIAPWVISVGATTISKQRSSFSSGGLEFDDSVATEIPDDGHLRFSGDRIGIYHPDVSAPGSDIVSSGTPTGGYVGPTEPGGTATASGTSMSSPHIAGMAALLLQARPNLTPDQVREIMQVTAVPMRDQSPFWHAGYGFADVKAAVDLVRRRDFGPKLLSRLQAERDLAVLSDRSWAVRSSDLWTFTPLPATVFGLDFHSYELEVTPETRAIKAGVAYPNATSLVGINFFDWFITVKDGAGNTVATSEASGEAGVSSLFVDLRDASALDADGNAVPIKYGTWTVELSGDLGTADVFEPLALNVTLSVVQLIPQVRAAVNAVRFVRSGNVGMFFQPVGDAGSVPSPEGCPMDLSAPAGGLAPAKTSEGCRAGIVGYAMNYGAGIPAEFSSAAFTKSLTIGGPGVITVYLSDTIQPAWSVAFASVLAYALDTVDAKGAVTGIAGGDMSEFATAGPTPTKGEYGFSIPPSVIPAGSHLRLRLSFSGFYTSTMRFLYGGEYADAGLTLPTGSFVASNASTPKAPKAPKAPKSPAKPAVLPSKQLAATGVSAAPWIAYLLLITAAVLTFGRRASRGRGH